MKEFILREGGTCSSLSNDRLTNEDQKFLLYKGLASGGNVNFVGITVDPANDNIYYAFPKYFLKNAIAENGIMTGKAAAHIRLLAKALKKVYFEANRLKSVRKYKRFDFEANRLEKDKKAVDQLSLAEYIINDYIRNGLYVYRVNETRKGGSGRIKWGNTVSRIQPFIFDGNVVYTDHFRKKSYIDENDTVTQIHAAVLCRLLKTFRLIFNEYGNVYVPESNISLNETESRDLCRLTLKKRLRCSYTDRDVSVIKAMLALLDETVWYSINYSYCTSAFELVWEHINREIWGTVNNIESEKPVYNFFNTEDKKNITTLDGSGNQEPDIVRCFQKKCGGENKSFLTVFDAKYYIPPYFPASTDISKQIGYLNMIKRDAVRYNKNIKFSNVFLMPTVMGEKDNYHLPYSDEKLCGNYGKNISNYLHVGFVEYPGFPFVKELYGNAENETDMKNIFDDRVELVAVNPHWLYTAYISGTADMNAINDFAAGLSENK